MKIPGFFYYGSRWLGEARKPRTWHRYQYAYASPISYYDPYGLQTCDPFSGWGCFGERNGIEWTLPTAEPTAPMPTGASLCPGPFTRWPDYWTLNFSIGYAFGGAIGIGFSGYIDRYGRLYGAIAPLSLGEGLPLLRFPASVNLSAGWLCQADTPTEEETQSFLTGWGTTVNIGAVIGLGVSESGGRKALEFGLYWPQIGGSIYHSWFITDFSALPSAPSIESYPTIEWDPSWGSPP